MLPGLTIRHLDQGLVQTERFCKGVVTKCYRGESDFSFCNVFVRRDRIPTDLLYVILNLHSGTHLRKIIKNKTIFRYQLRAPLPFLPLLKMGYVRWESLDLGAIGDAKASSRESISKLCDKEKERDFGGGKSPPPLG